MEQEKYVARILVRGTEIEEYYAFDQPLSEDEIEQIWVADVRDNRGFGPRLGDLFNGNVLVEQLWQKHHSARPEQEVKEIPSQRVEDVLEEDDERT